MDRIGLYRAFGLCEDMRRMLYGKNDRKGVIMDGVIWVQIKTASGVQYAITTKSHIDRSTYILWKQEDKSWKRVAKNSNPKAFDKMIDWGGIV